LRPYYQLGHRMRQYGPNQCVGSGKKSGSPRLGTGASCAPKPDREPLRGYSRLPSIRQPNQQVFAQFQQRLKERGPVIFRLGEGALSTQSRLEAALAITTRTRDAPPNPGVGGLEHGSPLWPGEAVRPIGVDSTIVKIDHSLGVGLRPTPFHRLRRQPLMAG